MDGPCYFIRLYFTSTLATTVHRHGPHTYVSENGRLTSRRQRSSPPSDIRPPPVRQPSSRIPLPSDPYDTAYPSSTRPSTFRLEPYPPLYIKPSYRARRLISVLPRTLYPITPIRISTLIIITHVSPHAWGSSVPRTLYFLLLRRAFLLLLCCCLLCRVSATASGCPRRIVCPAARCSCIVGIMPSGRQMRILARLAAHCCACAVCVCCACERLSGNGYVRDVEGVDETVGWLCMAAADAVGED